MEEGIGSGFGGGGRLDFLCSLGGWSWGGEIYCSAVKVFRSLRSAPLQKALGSAEARIKTRGAVAEEGSRGVLLMVVIWSDSSARRRREMALRVAGLLRLRMRIVPVCGAGMSVIWIRGDGRVEERRRWGWRWGVVRR